jgi:hypothetical protein
MCVAETLSTRRYPTLALKPNQRYGRETVRIYISELSVFCSLGCAVHANLVCILVSSFSKKLIRPKSFKVNVWSRCFDCVYQLETLDFQIKKYHFPS